MIRPQIVMEADTRRVRATDPITSHEAAANADRTGSKSFVMFALIEHELLAPFELEAKAGKMWSPSRIRTALSELADAGLVEPSGIYRNTPSGRAAQVWQLA